MLYKRDNSDCVKDSSTCSVRGLFSGFALLALFTVSLLLLAQTAIASVNGGVGFQDIPKGYNCITCHQDLDDEVLTPPVNNWMESAHRVAGVKCADCHGGDPADEDMAMDPAAGFIGKPKPADIPALCAKCHANAKLMRLYDKKSDQYALYSASVHGQKVKEGDTEAPTCVDCHGKHKILRVKDPKSTVNRANIPNTCGSCHAKKEIFEKRGKPSNQLELYKKSRHYELFSKGDNLVPTCVDCHGNHGVANVKKESVQTVCFKCHAQQADFYKASAHYVAFKKEGQPVCLHCHNNHDIVSPSVDKFAGTTDIDCVSCHKEGSAQYEAGLKIRDSVVAGIVAMEAGNQALGDFGHNAEGGFDISDLEESVSKMEDSVKELHTLTHKMKVDEIVTSSDAIVKISGDVVKKIDAMWSELKIRRLGLAAAWLVFFGLTWAIWQKSKALDKLRED